MPPVPSCFRPDDLKSPARPLPQEGAECRPRSPVWWRCASTAGQRSIRCAASLPPDREHELSQITQLIWNRCVLLMDWMPDGAPALIVTKALNTGRPFKTGKFGMLSKATAWPCPSRRPA